MLKKWKLLGILLLTVVLFQNCDTAFESAKGVEQQDAGSSTPPPPPEPPPKPPEPPVANAGLLFEDAFSSGDFSKHNANFRWGGSGAIPSSGEGADRIVQVVGPSGSMVRAIRFQYEALSSNASSDEKHWKEERFHLTASLNEARTEAGASNVAHQEIWLRYSLFVPANYAHGPIDPSNNKGFFTLWKGSYQSPRNGVALDFWRAGATSSSVNSWIWNDSLGHSVGFEPPTFIAPEFTQATETPYGFLPADYGKWVDFAFGLKAADVGQNNGYVRIYRNGQLIVEWARLNNSSRVAGMNGWDRGYLLGYHNSGYTTRTTFYLTHFRIGLSAQGIGLATR